MLTLENNGIEVRFTDIVHDGRCPENVDCFAAGEAVAELTIRKNSDEKTVFVSSQTGGKPD